MKVCNADISKTIITAFPLLPIIGMHFLLDVWGQLDEMKSQP